MTQYTEMDRISDEEYKEVMEEFTRSRGFHLFQSELYAQSVNIGNLQDVKDNDDLQFRKGQLALIGFVLNYQDLMEQDDHESS